MEESTSTPKKKKKIHIWPVAIVVSLLLFMSGIVYAVAIMMNIDVPMVSENYYEEELKYQDQIEIEKRTISTDRIPKLIAQGDGSSLVIQFSPENKIEMDAGEISFERPADNTLDFSFPVNPDEGGKQFIDLGSARPGLYLVRISWQEDGVSYYHETKYSFK